MNTVKKKLKALLRPAEAVALPLVFTLLLSGCWDSKDIQMYNIAISGFYDKTDDGYELYIETAKTLGDPKQSESGDGDASRGFIHGTGPDLNAVRVSVDRQSDNEVYISAIRTVTFGQGFAAEGLEKYLNRFRSTDAYRKNILIFTTDVEDIEELTKVEPDNNVYIGMSIESTLKSDYEHGTDISVDAQDLLQANAAGNPCYILPVVNVAGKQAVIEGYAVFKDNMKTGEITDGESRGLIYLMSDRARFLYDVPYADNNWHVYSRLRGKKITPSYADGHLKFDIEVTVENTLYYPDKSEKINAEVQKQLSEQASAQVQTDIEEILERSRREFKCDFMEFYKYFKGKYQDKYGRIGDWSEQYNNAEFNLKIRTVFNGSAMRNIGDAF